MRSIATVHLQTLHCERVYYKKDRPPMPECVRECAALDPVGVLTVIRLNIDLPSSSLR